MDSFRYGLIHDTFVLRDLLFIVFSKMQQLRKEFQQAKSILQLMLEREQMNEVRTYMLEFIIAANQF